MMDPTRLVGEEDARRRCPDGGTCHHDCFEDERCWRVDNTAPLSGVFPRDEWPAAVRGPREVVRQQGEEEPYRLWVNAERTVLVRLWPDGACEVATRPDAGAAWGPPIAMAAER